jgi:hypothetical protein
MAGPFTIQRVPRGLLDFMGLRGSGQLPQELDDRIRATVDATVLYARDDWKWAYQQNVLSTSWLKTATHTVPQLEMWVISTCWATCLTGPGVTAISRRPAIRRANAGLFDNYIDHNAQFPVPENGDVRYGWTFPFGELILAPGDVMGATLEGITGGIAAVGFGLEYYRIGL